jgi:hypothetical protein
MNGSKKLSLLAGLLALAPMAVPANTATAIGAAKRDMARHVAHLLGDTNFTASLSSALDHPLPAPEPASIVTPLRPLLADYDPKVSTVDSYRAARSIEMNALRAKGTAALSRGLFEVRMHLPAGHAVPARLDTLWVAFEPEGDESSWTRIEAYDAGGNVHFIDPKSVPAFPLLIVDVDSREDMRSGLTLVNRTLREQGLQDVPPDAAPAMGEELTLLKTIRLNDDEEPFFSGAAEVYAIESGVAKSGDKPQIVVHDMPWLDHERVVYQPGQPVIHWSGHGADVANLQLMEQDDNADWTMIASLLVKAVGQSVGPVQPTAAIVANIADSILKAVPSGAFTNADDYVDSFYLLRRGRSYTNLAGARGNALANFEPYAISPLR